MEKKMTRFMQDITSVANDYTRQMREQEKRQQRFDLALALKKIPADERQDAIAAALTEIAEEERRAEALERVGELSTDEIELLLKGKSR
jgi:hypothetical protein